MKRFFCILLLMALSGLLLTGAKVDPGDTEKSGHYAYPIDVTSGKWFDYTVLEKSEMLRIDDETLGKMTDEDLVYAIADYPYLVDYLAYGEDIRRFSEYCSAMGELLSRETCADSLKKYSRQIVEEYKTRPREDGRSTVVSYLLQDIAEAVSETSRDDSGGLRASYVYTPNGSLVSVTQPSESHTTAYHQAADADAVSTYGVSLVRCGSCKYNHHSYAWYSTASTNNCWMNNPSAYMTDGSYALKYSGGTSSSLYSYGISQNDRLYYANNTHSAIFTGYTGGGAPFASYSATSKWGTLGVFVHGVTNVPAGYNYTTISIWHR
ncbi:MAG: hypothetical protein IK150_08480 [Lachnospiraceae bacterium]|nr:hypothetical protein [Lachnospiraceae bacterium]